jgi:lipopolysaccharide export system ATP-binding protein
MMASLRTEHLTKSYGGRRVVDDVSIEVRRGEIVGLLGPNGAGKTTTFNMIVGLIRANGGKVYIGDKEITNMPMYKRVRLGIGYLPQEPSIFRNLTVKENIQVAFESMGIRKSEREKRISEILKELSLEDLSDRKASTLSMGMQRRVEIARVLAISPTFLLLDEPFSEIDPITVADIQGILERLKEAGVGILVTDHNVRDTLEITDRAYIIYDGRILISGNGRDLAEDEEVRRIYLGSRFRL